MSQQQQQQGFLTGLTTYFGVTKPTPAVLPPANPQDSPTHERAYLDARSAQLDERSNTLQALQLSLNRRQATQMNHQEQLRQREATLNRNEQLLITREDELNNQINDFAHSVQGLHERVSDLAAREVEVKIKERDNENLRDLYKALVTEKQRELNEREKAIEEREEMCRKMEEEMKRGLE